MCLDTKNLTLLHMNNKGADQPVYAHSLISTFVIHFLESRTPLVTCKFLIFYIVSAAEVAGLNLSWLQTLKTGFLVSRPILVYMHSQLDVIFNLNHHLKLSG